MVTMVWVVSRIRFKVETSLTRGFSLWGEDTRGYHGLGS